MSAPCDWDMQSYCVRDGCTRPATHPYLIGMVQTGRGAPLFELVCCLHAQEQT